MNKATNSSASPVGQLLREGSAARTPDGLLAHPPGHRATVLVCALTDLDGTANDEHVAEHLRLDTIGPARETFALLEASGVVTGICTARSTGEARLYRRELGVTGPLISENGAVVTYPDGTRDVFGDLSTLAEAVHRIEARLGRPVPNSLDFEGLRAAWERERRGECEVFLGHPDLDSLHIAAERSASCFLVGLTPAEKEIAADIAEGMNLSSFGHLLHLIARGADKGRALGALNDHLRSRPPVGGLRPEVIAQVVFGNGENDLPLFETALREGGTAVLVGDATTPGGFHFDSRRHAIPEGTIRFPGISHGHAIRRSLPHLRRFYRDRHGIDFPWPDEDGR